MERLTALAGVRAYLSGVNTEFRVRGGRFLYEDCGVQGEAMRHFRIARWGCLPNIPIREKRISVLGGYDDSSL
mgnify:CR=1 FL=1